MAPQQSIFADDKKPLRVEAQFLIAELRDPYTSDEGAIRRTLENYPGLTEDEIRSWWRAAEFRAEVKESRAVAKGYAEEDAGQSSSPYTTDTDPYAVAPFGWRPR